MIRALINSKHTISSISIRDEFKLEFSGLSEHDSNQFHAHLLEFM
jgi:hypothetical protein